MEEEKKLGFKATVEYEKNSLRVGLGHREHDKDEIDDDQTEIAVKTGFPLEYVMMKKIKPEL